MKKLRVIARETACLIPSSLPHGDVVIIITKALKQQKKDSDLKYQELLSACLKLKTSDDLSRIEKEIFTALVNIDLKN